MKLKELLNDMEYTIVQGSVDTQITGLTIDSRKVTKGSLFVAIQGRDFDGHKFIPMAVEKGAAAVLVDNNKANDRESGTSPDAFPVISVQDTRDVLSRISNEFYGHPEKSFNLIGVTGTNGKTSVTVILNHVLTLLGHKTGLIGTIANYCGDEVLDVERTTPTTPDCIELAQIMRLMADKGAQDMIMEASSMGLKTKRVKELTFDVGVFTNISPEHLDDHKTMEDYKVSKLMLFKQSQKSVVNIDDDFAQSIVDVSESTLRYGIKNKKLCDLYADNIEYTNDGVSFRMVYGAEHFKVKLMIPSEFAVYNVLAVAGTCLQLGIEFKDLEGPIQDEIVVAGRYDIVQTERGFTGIVDYAHTEVALENLLNAVKANPSYRRVISVFGCGGDRDPTKREPMGKVSGTIADYTIVTSDNPRTEDPKSIVDMVEVGVKEAGGDYQVVVDRGDAIKTAIDMASEGDAIVIAGKGHETYQILADRTIDFDDKEVFQSYSSLSKG